MNGKVDFELRKDMFLRDVSMLCKRYAVRIDAIVQPEREGELVTAILPTLLVSDDIVMFSSRVDKALQN